MTPSANPKVSGNRNTFCRNTTGLDTPTETVHGRGASGTHSGESGHGRCGPRVWVGGSESGPPTGLSPSTGPEESRGKSGWVTTRLPITSETCHPLETLPDLSPSTQVDTGGTGLPGPRHGGRRGRGSGGRVENDRKEDTGRPGRPRTTRGKGRAPHS